MSHIVIRKAKPDSKERDEVYNSMFEGRPQCTLTLGKRAFRCDKDMAELCAKQLNGLFPAHEWKAVPEAEFKYKAVA